MWGGRWWAELELELELELKIGVRIGVEVEGWGFCGEDMESRLRRCLVLNQSRGGGLGLGLHTLALL